MSKYRFHYQDGVDLHADLDGSEFETIAEARAEAIRTARNIMSQEVQRGRLDLTATISVEDDEGAVTTVLFSDAIEIRS